MAEPRLAAAAGAQGVRVNLTRTPTPRTRFEAAIRAFLFGAAVLSVVTTLAIVGSLIVETIQFFGEVPIKDYLFGTRWAPDVRRRAAVVRRPAAGLRHALRVVDRAGRRGPARPAGRDLPVRVRAERACARSSSRSSRSWPACPTIVFGYFALTYFTPEILRGAVRDRGQHLQRALRGHDHGPARAADDRVGGGGRDVRGARLAARGRLRPRGEQAPGLAADRLPGRALGHRRGPHPRRVARRRRDRAGARRRRPDPEHEPRSDRQPHDDGGVHRLDLAR